MDFAHLMEWVWLSYKGRKPLTLRDFLNEMLDYSKIGRSFIIKMYPHSRRLMEISDDAPMSEMKKDVFTFIAKPVKVENR
nr:hypothetical protein [Stygiolobus azoricus]